MEESKMLIMEKGLNEIQALKSWGKSFVIPRLNTLNDQLKSAKKGDLSYSRIEVTHNDNIYTWMISSVTNTTWERSKYSSINEVVLEVSIQMSNNDIILDADVSFGDGNIMFEMDSIKIPYNINLTKLKIRDTIQPKLEVFLNLCFFYLATGIENIINEST